MQKFMTIKFDRDCPVAQFFDHNQNDEEMMSLVSLNKIVIDIYTLICDSLSTYYQIPFECQSTDKH